MLSVVERALAEYRISTARDGDEALVVLSRDDHFDLLITDYLMPGMTGETLVHEARKRRPTLPVLVITGHGGGVADADAAWWRDVPHLTKPFRMSALVQAVEKLIGPSHTSSDHSWSR